MMSENSRSQANKIIELSDPDNSILVEPLNHISSGPNLVYRVNINNTEVIYLTKKEILNSLVIVRAIEKCDFWKS